MLTLAGLASRSDICLGPLTVSPARRSVKGPGGEAHLEPRVMQVFLLLIDAGGRVVTRQELFEQCWGGAMVGNDNINHAIATIRKVAAGVAQGAFAIETIPRTGYRLTGDILQDREAQPAPGGDTAAQPAVSRRALVGGAAALAALGGGAAWWLAEEGSRSRFEDMMQRGEDALRVDEPGASKYFDRAVALEPRNAKAWGLLAYALSNGREAGPSAVPQSTIRAAELAARSALRIDPNESNALLAMTFIQPGMLDWIAREREYLRIMSIDPDNSRVMRSLGQMLHAVGRCRESLAVVERALRIDPLSPDHQLRKAMRLWVLGRVAEADRVSDRAMQLWPNHRVVRLARLMIYAFTGRTRAALAMVEEEVSKPILLTPNAASVWRLSLQALETRTPAAVAAAREAVLAESKGTRAVAAYAILILSALGDVDGAFDVANGFLLGRGSIILQPRPAASGMGLNTHSWRNTFGLFTPPTKVMRLDPRFGALADGLGLTEYWHKRGIRPDDFLFRP